MKLEGLNNIWSNYISSKKLEGSFSERRQAFFILHRLSKREYKKVKEGELIKENILGFTFFSYDYWSLNYLFKEIFISKEYKFKTDEEEPLIFDCGANIGMSILYFKKMFPKSKIIAFEPNPHSWALLKKNLESNKLKDIECHNLGLFDSETEVPFHIGNNPGSLIASYNQNRGGDQFIKIKTARLSQFLNRYESIDLVKMDIEGAEVSVINEICDSQALNKVKEFIIEYHHNLQGEISCLSEFLRKFEDEGFKYNIRANFSRPRSFQDILIHFYK